MSLPPLLVLPDSYVPGAVSVDRRMLATRTGDPASRRPASHASGWLSNYRTDAHCVAYHVPGQPYQPRLTKRILPELIEHGHEPVLAWALIDVDLPGHAEWLSPEEALSTMLTWRELGPDPECGVYATPHGARLVYPLAEPVPVSQAEPMLLGLIEHLRAAGVPADPVCRDWTRLYRMPRATRPGVGLLDLPLDFPWLP